MSDKFQDRTMAFAGICQAAYLVQKVARDGTCDEASLRESLQSVLVTDPKQPLEVFGSHLAIRDGYRALVEQLGADGSQKNAELTRYVGTSADLSEPTMYLDLLTEPDRLDQSEMERLSRLVGKGTFAAVLGPGIPSELGHGIRGTGQRTEPQPEAQWAAITLGPGFCMGVLARRATDQPESWEYGVTHEWAPTIAAARSLVRLLGALPAA